MRAVRVRITYELLREALRLPKEARIVGTDNDWGGYPESMNIYVEAPDFEDLGEGEMAPLIGLPQLSPV